MSERMMLMTLHKQESKQCLDCFYNKNYKDDSGREYRECCGQWFSDCRAYEDREQILLESRADFHERVDEAMYDSNFLDFLRKLVMSNDILKHYLIKHMG